MVERLFDEKLFLFPEYFLLAKKSNYLIGNLQQSVKRMHSELIQTIALIMVEFKAHLQETLLKEGSTQSPEGRAASG